MSKKFYFLISHTQERSSANLDRTLCISTCVYYVFCWHCVDLQLLYLYLMLFSNKWIMTRWSPAPHQPSCYQRALKMRVRYRPHHRRSNFLLQAATEVCYGYLFYNQLTVVLNYSMPASLRQNYDFKSYALHKIEAKPSVVSML